MKRKLTLSILFWSFSFILFSQSVGISPDGSNPDTSAMLDVKSNSKGMLIPRMTQAQRNSIVLPATGLMIFQTDNTPGFYYYSGATWTTIAPNNFWYLNGNAGTSGSNFIGTIDNQPLNFKINNQFAGRITTRSTALGLSAMSFSSGVDNTAIGNSALLFNSTGTGNVANGTEALRSNTTGFNNTASGFQSMYFNQAGAFNTAMGSVSLAANLATANSAFGSNALENNTTGTYNTSSGAFALTNNTTGSQNTALGSNANVLNGNLSNATAIGSKSRVDCDNCLVLGSVNGINGATSNVKVGIGTSNPNASSALEINSTDKGLLIPRMTQSQRDAISTPVNGLMIYQINNSPGFYYHNGSSWTSVSSSTNNLWNLNGNAGTTSLSFVGTSDAQPLYFKVNNEDAGRIDLTYNTVFGRGALPRSTNITDGWNTAFGANALHSNSYGYFNTALGTGAAYSTTYGHNNVAIGLSALYYNTVGVANIAIGNHSLENSNTGDFNIGIGQESLFSNNSGSNNIGIGRYAISGNTTGSQNIAIGNHSMQNSQSGNYNIGIGEQALSNITDGIDNIALGHGALANIKSNHNIAIGNGALTSVIDGYENIALGHGALGSNKSAYNIAIGTNALSANTDGYINVAIGYGALASNQSTYNVGIGTNALGSNNQGYVNVALGHSALVGNTDGTGNVGIGHEALAYNATGYDNTAIGIWSDVGSPALFNTTAIGANARVDCNNCLVLGSVNGVKAATSDARVGIGTTNPNTSAALEVSSSDKGLLIPRMTQAQRDVISSPATSLLIYQTNNTPGFYYYSGSSWISISGGSSGWSLNGNGGTNPSTNFIGTTDNQPLSFRVSDEFAGKIERNNTQNTFLGALAGSLSTGGSNVAFGFQSFKNNTSGYGNAALGYVALRDNTTGHSNSAFGTGALLNNTEGFWNTAVGEYALVNNTTGYTNTGVGQYANVSSGDLTNATAIGFNALVDASNKVRIGNSGVTVIEGQVPFTTPSDGRYKFNVREDVAGLDFILKLRPVTYQFDTKKFDDELLPAGFKNASYTSANSFSEASAIRRTGFIAQEVETAATEAGFNFSGIIKPKTSKDHYGLSYDSFVMPLVKAVQEQQKQIEDLKKENEELKKLKQQVEELAKRLETLSSGK